MSSDHSLLTFLGTHNLKFRTCWKSAPSPLPGESSSFSSSSSFQRPKSVFNHPALPEAKKKRIIHDTVALNNNPWKPLKISPLRSRGQYGALVSFFCSVKSIRPPFTTCFDFYEEKTFLKSGLFVHMASSFIHERKNYSHRDIPRDQFPRKAPNLRCTICHPTFHCEKTDGQKLTEGGGKVGDSSPLDILIPLTWNEFYSLRLWDPNPWHREGESSGTRPLYVEPRMQGGRTDFCEAWTMDVKNSLQETARIRRSNTYTAAMFLRRSCGSLLRWAEKEEKEGTKRAVFPENLERERKHFTKTFIFEMKFWKIIIRQRIFSTVTR